MHGNVHPKGETRYIPGYFTIRCKARRETNGLRGQWQYPRKISRKFFRLKNRFGNALSRSTYNVAEGTDLIWTTGNKRKRKCDPATKKRSLFPGGPAWPAISEVQPTRVHFREASVELLPKFVLLLARVNLSDRAAAHMVGRPIGTLERFRR